MLAPLTYEAASALITRFKSRVATRCGYGVWHWLSAATARRRWRWRASWRSSCTPCGRMEPATSATRWAAPAIARRAPPARTASCWEPRHERARSLRSCVPSSRRPPTDHEAPLRRMRTRADQGRRNARCLACGRRPRDVFGPARVPVMMLRQSDGRVRRDGSRPALQQPDQPVAERGGASTVAGMSRQAFWTMGSGGGPHGAPGLSAVVHGALSACIHQRPDRPWGPQSRRSG